MPTARRTPATRRSKAAASSKRKPATAASPPDEPLILVGPPGRLRGTVTVANAVDERVAVRGAVLHREGEPTLSGAATALIPPGATAAVPVTLGLARTTAPGEETAELEVGGIRRPARLIVEPEPAVRVSPRRLLAAPGALAFTLAVVNDGNVPIPLAVRTRARTDDGGPDPGPDVTLTVPDAPVVPPGGSVAVAAELTVPDLDPTRRHLARMPVGTADIDVIILPRTETEEPQ
jgi:hypothetical protein